jgi:hypothetical protein
MTLPGLIQIDLTSRSFNLLTVPEVSSYIGGEAVSNYLLLEYLKRNPDEDQNYFSIITGPFCGVFPYASKSVASLYKKGSYQTLIGGGNIGAFLNLSNLIGIEIFGQSKEPLSLDITPKNVSFIPYNSQVSKSLGLVGRRSILSFTKELTCDEYHSFGEVDDFVDRVNLKSITFSSQAEYRLKDLSNYKEAYQSILAKQGELLVSSGSNPSCFGCPMGCAFSASPESQNVSLLARSLVSCAYAEPIYSNVGTVFSCFQALEYPYDHEFLETFSYLHGNLKKELVKLI